MANQKITTLPAAAGPLTGPELLEIVVGGVNSKVTATVLRGTALYQPEAPGAGTITDLVLPGSGDYILDYDTSGGDIEVDGVISQRDGQEVTFLNGGANLLKLGVNISATPAHRVRANAGPLTALQNDCIKITYVQTISRWIVK